MLPIRLVEQFISSFSPSALPIDLQRNYARELLSWLFLPFMLGAMEGGALGVVVNKVFSGTEGIDQGQLNIAVACVTAAPNVANLASFMWAALAHGRRKVPFIATLQVGTCILSAAIAFVPVTPWGIWAIVGLVLAARTLWTGVITIRTSVWRHNYPRANRARIAGKMAIVQSMVLAVSGLAIGQSMDFSPQAYHYLFPVLAVLGLIGNAIYRGVTLTDEEAIVQAELNGHEDGRPSLNPAAIVKVLREDAHYRSFMIYMFIFGIGNLMMTPPQILILEQQFKANYFDSILITTVIPLSIMPIAIPLWAKYMDRVHTIEFRAVHGWSFVSAAAAMLGATVFESLPLFYMSSVLLGIGYSGGVLAWNLGHHDFAPRNRDAQYMGVHVTLNGLRAMIAPFLAVWIYESLDHRWGVSGAAWTFLACVVVSIIGLLGFVRLARTMSTSGTVPTHHRP
ncbi:MAG: MFS transporter [Planctomycetota bacterium]|nr:MFS transporter [Planctomycetota bacterium]